MGATWHARPRGRATQARAAPTWHILHIYLYYIIIRGIQPPVYREGIRPLRSSGVINPTILFFYFRVGLIHMAFIMQVTWRDKERWIAIEGCRSGGHADHQIWSCTCLLKRIITVRFSETWRHHTLRSRGRADHRRSSKARALNTELWRPGLNLGGSIWRVGSRSNGGDLSVL